MEFPNLFLSLHKQNKMDKEFVPYQPALELKELGFDEPCLAYYERGKELVIQECEVTDFHFDSLQCVAPTFSQAFRWFREKYELHSYIEPVLVEKANSPIKYDYVILEVSHQNDLEYNNLPYHTFEEAELACLLKLIEITKIK